MNFSRRPTEERRNKLKSKRTRIINKVIVTVYQLSFLAVILLTASGIFAGIGLVQGLFDSAPSIQSINVVPNGYATKIYDANGKLIDTLVGENANREYVTLDQIPKYVQNAFIAIEDERFWMHNGIDVRGIFRAAATGFRSNDFSEGASTLTQQLLKNQVFNGGQEVDFIEKVKRKIQEQYLAVELEHELSKEQILEYYLNTINLGQNTLGVEAASKRYFGKKTKKLTLSEAAVMAGITQNPTAYNPIMHPDRNKKKRSTILSYMKEQGYITAKQYEKAMKDDVYKRIKLINEKREASTKNSLYNSYFTDSLIEQVLSDLKDQLGYTETQAYNALYRGGLRIYATQDLKKQKIIDRIINNPSYYPTETKMQLSYRLSVMDKSGTEKHYDEQAVKSFFEKKKQNVSIYFTKKEDAKKYVRAFKKSVVKKGYKVTGEVIHFIIQPQTSFVLMDQSTGEVKAISGGRGEKTGNRTLNRATSSFRQPGSTFKIVSTFLPALDTSGMTLASVKDDAKYYYPGTKKEVKNWYSTGYRGLTSMREAIANSMNIVAVKTLVDVTPKTGYDYLLNLGFTSLVENMTSNGKNYTDIALPMALGGLTRGVSNLELTGAFAAIANQGVYNKATFYTKILDHDGNVLIEKKPTARQVMHDSTAWLLTSAMQDVVKRGSGTLVKFQSSKTPVAGKTGTTTKNVDLWFVGYTPYLTAGIWGGYDQNEKQTQTTYHKVIWRTIMEKISDSEMKKAFKKPSSITSVNICTKCGNLAVKGLCDNAIGGSCIKKEYFAIGNIPTESCNCHIKCRICSASGKLATENCPSNLIMTRIYLQKDEKTPTADTPYVLPSGLANSICHIHQGRSTSTKIRVTE